MRAVDTNILVYAALPASLNHKVALQHLTALAEGSALWAIPWPRIYEFLRVLTHPRAHTGPVRSEEALEWLRGILISPSRRLLSETENHWQILQTGDADFHLFPGIKVVNPFK